MFQRRSVDWRRGKLAEQKKIIRRVRPAISPLLLSSIVLAAVASDKTQKVSGHDGKGHGACILPFAYPLHTVIPVDSSYRVSQRMNDCHNLTTITWYTVRISPRIFSRGNGEMATPRMTGRYGPCSLTVDREKVHRHPLMDVRGKTDAS
jgi:hypothetical protein